MTCSTIHARCNLVPSVDHTRLLASVRAPRTAAHLGACSATCSTSGALPPLSLRPVPSHCSTPRQNSHTGSRGFTACSAALSEAVAEATAESPEATGDVPHHNGTAQADEVLSSAVAAVLNREWLPEEFELEAGAVSTVDREGLNNPDDIFRCSGCSLPECQVQLSQASQHTKHDMGPSYFCIIALMSRVYLRSYTLNHC